MSTLITGKLLSLSYGKYSVLTSWQTMCGCFYLTFTIGDAFNSCTPHTLSSILLDTAHFL